MLVSQLFPPVSNKVTFDAVGTGFADHTGTASWTHTTGPNANALVVTSQIRASTAPTYKVFVGATQMQAGGAVSDDSYTSGYASYIGYWLSAQPNTTYTITSTLAGSYWTINSLSYCNVNSVWQSGTYWDSSGAYSGHTTARGGFINGGTLALTYQSVSGLAVAPGGMNVIMIGSAVANAAGITAFSGTTRWNTPYALGNNYSGLAGDFPSDTTTSASWTPSGVTTGACGILLLP